MDEAFLQSSNEPIHIVPSYNKVSESLRRAAPSELSCTIFCGGKRCKYESETFWDTETCAVKGLFSHWITEDILAMSRPNSLLIQKFDLIGQFNTLGIQSVINLQIPGEHENCSPAPLHSSGFSYDPNMLMENGIYFYNYAWKDYGEASLSLILDMVKVLSFSITQGKVAVHCHAGLGRTGVLIACYLVYANRVRANEALRYVRSKRPGSIQSRLHILSVQQFEQFILPNCIIFCNKEILKDKKLQDFTLAQYLKRQRFLLHGTECKTLRHIPKILNVICERLLELCGKEGIIPLLVYGKKESDKEKDRETLENAYNSDEQSNVIVANGHISEESFYPVEDVIRALLYDHVNMADGLFKFLKQYRMELNQKGREAWIRLSNEKNLYILTALLFLWLEHLRNPLLGNEELTVIVVHSINVDEVYNRIPPESVATIDYLFNFLANLNYMEKMNGVILRFITAFTHRATSMTGESFEYANEGFFSQFNEKAKPRKINEGTQNKIITLLFKILQRHQKTNSLKLLTINDNDNIDNDNTSST